jgi:hypothetical protein
MLRTEGNALCELLVQLDAITAERMRALEEELDWQQFLKCQHGYEAGSPASVHLFISAVRAQLLAPPGTQEDSGSRELLEGHPTVFDALVSAAAQCASLAVSCCANAQSAPTSETFGPPTPIVEPAPEPFSDAPSPPSAPLSRAASAASAAVSVAAPAPADDAVAAGGSATPSLSCSPEPAVEAPEDYSVFGDGSSPIIFSEEHLATSVATSPFLILASELRTLLYELWDAAAHEALTHESYLQDGALLLSRADGSHALSLWANLARSARLKQVTASVGAMDVVYGIPKSVALTAVALRTAVANTAALFSPALPPARIDGVPLPPLPVCHETPDAGTLVPIGDVLYAELISLPTPRPVLNKWAVEVPSVLGVAHLPFPLGQPGCVPVYPGAPHLLRQRLLNQEVDLAATRRADMTVTMTVPEHVHTGGAPIPAVWASGGWSPEGFTDVKFDRLARSLTFTSGRLGAFSLVVPASSSLPFRGEWHASPVMRSPTDETPSVSAIELTIPLASGSVVLRTSAEGFTVSAAAVGASMTHGALMPPPWSHVAAAGPFHTAIGLLTALEHAGAVLLPREEWADELGLAWRCPDVTEPFATHISLLLATAVGAVPAVRFVAASPFNQKIGSPSTGVPGPEARRAAQQALDAASTTFQDTFTDATTIPIEKPKKKGKKGSGDQKEKAAKAAAAAAAADPMTPEPTHQTIPLTGAIPGTPGGVTEAHLETRQAAVAAASAAIETLCSSSIPARHSAPPAATVIFSVAPVDGEPLLVRASARPVTVDGFTHRRAVFARFEDTTNFPTRASLDDMSPSLCRLFAAPVADSADSLATSCNVVLARRFAALVKALRLSSM